MIYRRTKYLDKIYSSIKSGKLVMLLWTRQVWKTTILEILKKELPWKVYYYSFEDDFFKQEFSDKNDFINYFTISLWVDFYNEGYFLFDEFQYVKNWEKILKSLYDDENVKLKLIVTWSWLWSYSDQNEWTLVWRWDEIYIYPFDFFEFLEFSWIKPSTLKFSNLSEKVINLITPYYKQYLTFWGYPKVVVSKTSEEKIKELEKIVNRYIERDIVYFLWKEELIDFKRFFVYLNSQIWNLVKKEAIWEYLGIKIKQVEKYLYILEKTMFIFRVYPFFKDKSKELSQQPKVYFWDIGVINYLQKSFDFRENDWSIVENFVFNELQKNKIYNSDELKTYKKLNKSEIDFIYDWLDLFLPIEVKSGNKKVIPKIFYSLEGDYNKKTDFYIMTNLDYAYEDKVLDKQIFIIPNWFVSKMFLNKGK